MLRVVDYNEFLLLYKLNEIFYSLIRDCYECVCVCEFMERYKKRARKSSNLQIFSLILNFLISFNKIIAIFYSKRILMFEYLTI